MATIRAGTTRPQIISGNPGLTNPPGRPPVRLPRGVITQTPGNDYQTSYTGGNANDKLIARDRSVVLTRGTEKTGRLSGNHDPLLDGPVRPSLMSINRTINQQQGFAPRATDDLSRGYSHDSNGRWIGQQDGSVQSVSGGTPGMWIPYGSYAGYTTGPVKGIQSPVLVGSPGDGPQKLRSGPPHGLHTATLPNYVQLGQRYKATPQMVPTNPSRPFNSKISGQSYSQTVAPLGQTPAVYPSQVRAGTVRTVGYTPGSAWRGR